MITLVNTTQDNRESVLFQPILKVYPTNLSWIITEHVSLGNMEKQWKLFTKQMIRTHQPLPCLLWKPAAPTQLLSGLDEEFSKLNSIHTLLTTHFRQPLNSSRENLHLLEYQFPLNA